jgi:GntR family transcriptional regulator, transcriptional repressor for pyruvate dehydrogenase complex
MIDQKTLPSVPRQLVPVTAERLRTMIFAREPGAQIGSLAELAQALGVGIVTVQQAARILEHEGLLEVRRGPGGGYFGRRPDVSTLERALVGYMRSEPASRAEVLDMTSLLFNELCAAAARCSDAAQHDELRKLATAIGSSDADSDIGPLEERLQNQLFRMVNRPFFELLTRVALQIAQAGEGGRMVGKGFGLARWKDSRRIIIDAILRRDPELAHFEANRRNRQVVVSFAHDD